MLTAAEIRQFRKKLLGWYAQNRRRLPWQDGVGRFTRNAREYRVFVSEVMLQQTRVNQALPYYKKWVDKIPDFESLAKTPMQKLLKLWEGLGYYARVRHLKKAAQIITGKHNGRIPADFSEIRALPGVGDYTASALASFIHGQPRLSIDGNVFRVLSRLLAKPFVFSRGADRRELSVAAFPLLDQTSPGNFNRALMRLGVLVCLPKKPQCAVCPVGSFCRAYQSGTIGQYPLPKKKLERPHYPIAAGIVWKDGKILIAQRKSNGLLGGLWEFPGGKKKPRESLQTACRREIQEETGVTVRAGPLAQRIEHSYSHFSITLSIFHCQYRSGTPKPLGCQKIKWVKPKELVKYPFPKANQKVVPLLATGKLFP
jgi:A/G-specific adenine glycosylase